MLYEFTKTLTCDGVPRKAGDRASAEEIHPGSLKSLVRLGQVKEVPDSAIAIQEPDETISPENDQIHADGETIPADGETPDKPNRRKKQITGPR